MAGPHAPALLGVRDRKGQTLSSLQRLVFLADESRLRAVLSWLLVGGTVALYWRVSFFPFVNYDDPAFVGSNPHVYTGLSWANLKWAFTALSGGAASYQPLVWLSHQLDCSLFGLKAGPQHLTNLWLHVINSVLLFNLVDRLTHKPLRSALVAALFAVHPLHIQSVVWISERKTLVCTLFWFSCILAYTGYVRTKSLRSYLVVVLLAAAALLSKPIAVSLPFTLLLLDVWPLGRWARSYDGFIGGSTSEAQPRTLLFLIMEKAPLFLLSGLACYVTILAQLELGAVQPLKEVSTIVRMDNSLLAGAGYLRKTVWPSELAVIYPLKYACRWWELALALAVLAMASFYSFRCRKSRPYLIVGWLWYLISIFPTLSFVQVGLQGMADRYTYVPLVGVFVAAVWATADAAQLWKMTRLSWVLGIFSVAACATVSTPNIGYWKSSVDLFSHAVEVTSNNFVAHRLLGMAYQNLGNFHEAEKEYRESLKVNDTRGPSHRCLANVLFLQGKEEEALRHYTLALKLAPRDAQSHRNIAEFLLRTADPHLRNPTNALEHAREACELNHYRRREYVAFLATAYAENHHLREALEMTGKALALSVGPEETEASARLARELSTGEPAGPSDGVHEGEAGAEPAGRN